MTMKNPTGAHHTLALNALSRDAHIAAMSINASLTMAIDPDCYLAAKDIDEPMAKFEAVVRGLRVLRSELMADEEREKIKRVRTSLRPVTEEAVPR